MTLEETPQEAIARLEARVAELELLASQRRPPEMDGTPRIEPYVTEKLDATDIQRYSRHLLMPQMGVEGQARLRHASVAIVGCGGLGAPAALYLAAAGVGRLTLIDHDRVELSNLQRQIIHTEARVGTFKSDSSKIAIHQLNSSVVVNASNTLLGAKNAIAELKEHNLVLDCTDNVATRYLLNDTCVSLGIPLVSGSALMLEGQLTIYGLAGGPCYRCLFPRPPPQWAVSSCSDAGVLGVVPGVIGVLQAAEAIKVLIGADPGSLLSQRMLVYDALGSNGTLFRTLRLRPAQRDCIACAPHARITEADIVRFDYEQLASCEAPEFEPLTSDASSQDLAKTSRITAKGVGAWLSRFPKAILLDVRETPQTHICGVRLVGGTEPLSLCVPLASLEERRDELVRHTRFNPEDPACHRPVLVVCRRGVDSQTAARQIVREFGFAGNVCDLQGGLEAYWRESRQAPVY